MCQPQQNQLFLQNLSQIASNLLFTVSILLIFISTCLTQSRMSVWKTVSQAQFPKL